MYGAVRVHYVGENTAMLRVVGAEISAATYRFRASKFKISV